MSATNSGLQNIREAVQARAPVMVIMSRDCGVSLAQLEAFAEGRVDLPPKTIQSIVKFVWQYVEYNPELDLLQSIPQPPPRSVGVLPKLELKLPKYTAGPAQNGGPQPEIAAPKKPARRPGWL